MEKSSNSKSNLRQKNLDNFSMGERFLLRLQQKI